jgi:hypothetical protein
MALTSTAEIKAFLNITDSSQDAWIEALRASAELNVKRYCDQWLEEETWTHFVTGNGRREIVLKERPVLEVDSVHIDTSGNFGQTAGAFAASTELVQGTDWALRYDGTVWGSSDPCSYSGLLVRLRSVWQEAPRFYQPRRLTPEVGPAHGNIQVVYTAGYTTIPEDLKYAVAMLVAWAQKTGTHGGHPLVSERIGDYSYELGALHRYSQYPELGSIRQILARYRDCPFELF